MRNGHIDMDRLAPRDRPETGRIVMRQRWTDLLFFHWEVDSELIQRTLPDGLTVDCHGGKTYLGLVPFLMERVRPAGMSAVPWISRFPEMNVRAYVIGPDGRPGVWFYSLDAARWIAVEVARAAFHLPYVWSKMNYRRDGDEVRYCCRRRDGGDGVSLRYGADGTLDTATPGSLEFFLLERYLLYSHDAKRNRIYCGQVHHRPYQWCPAAVGTMPTDPLRWNGFDDFGAATGPLFSPGVDVDIYPLKRIS